jgi:AcrR family transcriptional regulator
MTQSHLTDVETVLDAASDIIQNDGYSAVTLQSIALRAGVSVEEVEAMFPTANDAMVAMLNREFHGMYGLIVENIERDPRGGLLSRMYTYILSAVYERPLARTLFVIDREAMNSIMRNSSSYTYAPTVGIRGELIEALQEAGMVRADVDARQVSSILSACSAGLALTAPHDDLGLIIDGLSTLLSRGVDADVVDTSAGKAVFFDWATKLTLPKRETD